MDQKKNFFLVIEGIDGSGKSSLAHQVVEVLQDSLGNKVKLTFEPHDPSCAGVFIRQVLMKKIRNVPLRTLALAFATNRADHCDREIVPFLERSNADSRVVVCDRYYLSSLVYQTDVAVTFEDIMVLNANARMPDLTIFMNASDRICFKRMRKRQENKELFESHLSQTRRKYAAAIEFLRSRGEKVVEVQADGSIAQVRQQVLEAIHANSPEWFSVGTMPLPLEVPTADVFEPVSISMQSIAEQMSRFWNSGPIYSERHLIDVLEQLEAKIDEIVWGLQFSHSAGLFVDALERSGYEVMDKLPWIDLDAFGVRFTMPLGMTQHGAALLLGSSQRYDVIIKKLLGRDKVQTLDRISDFLFIFDSNPSHLITHYYERDIIKHFESSSLSPSVTVIGRQQLASMVLDVALEMFHEEYMFTLSGLPQLREALNGFRNTKCLARDWSGLPRKKEDA